MSRENEGATVEMLLRGFHLPTIAALYEPTIVRAETEGWSHRRVLEHLCQSEAADREQRRIGRLLAESGLPEGKTLGNLDEALLPAKIRRQLPALLEGGFVSRSTNILAFGLPGRGKTHFLAALGRELILRHSMRVLFRPTFKLVGQLLTAKRDLRLEAELKKLDRYQVVILDDIGYVQQNLLSLRSVWRPCLECRLFLLTPSRSTSCRSGTLVTPMTPQRATSTAAWPTTFRSASTT